MLKKTLPCLALALSLGACGVTPEEREVKARQFQYDWAREGIRATLEYRTVPLPPSKTTCAGRLVIDNYGSGKYAVLLFNVNVYSPSGILIATDRFSLSASLNPGGKAEIPFDPHNPLNPAVITTSYRECPKDMASVDVKLEAF